MQVFLEKKVDKRAIFIDERAVFGFKWIDGIYY
jgi:hypothetical protein